MPDLKISQFTDGNAVQETDEIATNRGGVNTKVRVGTAAAKNVGTGTGEIPLFDDLGTGAFANIGDGSGELLTVDELPNVLGDMAFKDLVTVADMDAESSTAGQVPVSDGSGGVTWQDQSGSGSTPAASVSFDNTGTNLAAVNAQTAIEEVSNRTGLMAGVRLEQDSGNLYLRPHNGGQIQVNGKTYVFTSPLILATTPAISTVYDIFVQENGSGGLALIAQSVATGHEPNSNGVEVMVGDATKTYVGKAKSAAGVNTWLADVGMCVSWYNRKHAIISKTYSTTRPVSSASRAEVNTEIRSTFLSFTGDSAISNFSSRATLSALNSVVGVFVSLNNSSPIVGEIYGTAFTAGANANTSCSSGFTLTEGENFVTVRAFVTAGTATFAADGLLTSLILI